MQLPPPEEMEQRILDIATRIFLENGYENTSVQDIGLRLGIPKDEVSTHFATKEYLLERAVFAYYHSKDWMQEILLAPGKTAGEKLRALFLYEVSNEEKLRVDQLYFSHAPAPEVLWEHLRLNLQEGRPMVERLIEQGNRDGSLQVKNPKEASELVLFLSNIWVSLCSAARKDFIRQMEACAQVTEQMGMPLFDGDLKEKTLAYYDRAQQWLPVQKN